MDLTADNVRAVFDDSLAASGEVPTLRAHGLFNEFFFNPGRLEVHRSAVRSFLGKLSTRYYVDRGGGHSAMAMGHRRDGEYWGGRPDVERLICVGLALGLVDFCLDRRLWHLFPAGLPYVRLPGDLFKLWATFRLPPRKAAHEPVSSVTLAFEAADHPAPSGIEEVQWYRPSTFEVGDLGVVPTHVAASYYNRVIVEGFFNGGLPSWILDSDTLLQVY